MKQQKMPADPKQASQGDRGHDRRDLGCMARAGADGKDPGRVERGKVSGGKGGKVRAEKLTLERRAEIARKAAAARWGKTT